MRSLSRPSYECVLEWNPTSFNIFLAFTVPKIDKIINRIDPWNNSIFYWIINETLRGTVTQKKLGVKVSNSIRNSLLSSCQIYVVETRLLSTFFGPSHSQPFKYDAINRWNQVKLRCEFWFFCVWNKRKFICTHFALFQ